MLFIIAISFFSSLLSPFFCLSFFCFLQLDLNSVPQNLVAWPTEPILKPTRAVVPPAFGVDISPIVWVMICSFLHEILLGQQGILNLISAKG